MATPRAYRAHQSGTVRRLRRAPAARAAPRRSAHVPRPRRFFIVLLALAGTAILLYPAAGNWFSDRAHAAEVTGYTETVDSMPLGERAAMLEQARTYNASLARGRIDDPYGLAAAAAAEAAAQQPAEQAASAGEVLGYRDQLSLSPSGTIARLRIPAIGVSLPVYHGTDDDVLTRGVGHLQGSALPVGGSGMNSVLTGHSGVPEATLLTDLHDLRGGETVSVDVLGETLTYEIDSISTVLPTETDLLQPVAGADLLTLVTCTPVGVNSHRLLVQAHRVDEGSASTAVTVGGTAGAGFPWWAVILCVALLASTWFVWQPVLRGGARRRARHSVRSAPRTQG